MADSLPCPGAWDVSLKERTTFRVGGRARVLLEPSSLEELERAVEWVRRRSLPLFVLGRGSNLVVSDGGWDGAILSIGRNLSGIAWEEGHATALAGTRLSELVMACVVKGLGGCESLAGIPGTVGGAALMNAGAYGQEFGERILQVDALSFDGTWRTFAAAECGFGYRSSAFRNGQWILYAVRVGAFLTEEAEELRRRVREIQASRREKQPLELPNAGSLFKRPPGGFAAKMIDEAGLRGFRVGEAAISEKHAGFAVNLGKATASDVWELSQAVIARVKESHGVTLEREVVFLGSFPRP
jgi:UDP-N-acetylmuramate dehydrogenase